MSDAMGHAAATATADVSATATTGEAGTRRPQTDGARPALTRAELLGAAAAGAGAVLTGAMARTARAATSDGSASLDEESPSGVARDDPYAGVGENLSYAGGGAGGDVAPYAVPQVTYAQERDESPRRVLVVVDYQVDFVSGGVFGDIQPAMAIEDALCAKIREYQQAGDVVIYTMDTHPSDEYDETREATVNPPHCDPATEGWHVYGKARALLEGTGAGGGFALGGDFASPGVASVSETGAILVKKGTYGSMDLPRVIETIRAQGTRITSIEFAGVSTTCRVLHNAIICYNAFPELPMIMDAATTASYTDERTEEQLEELEAWGFVVRR